MERIWCSPLFVFVPSVFVSFLAWYVSFWPCTVRVPVIVKTSFVNTFLYILKKKSGTVNILLYSPTLCFSLQSIRVGKIHKGPRSARNSEQQQEMEDSVQARGHRSPCVWTQTIKKTGVCTSQSDQARSV